MKRTSAGITSFYALLQSLYWVTNGLMFNYASVFLLDRGFNNGRIGMVLGFSYALSALMQPAFASVVSRTGVRLSSAMGCVYALVALLAMVIWLSGVEGWVLAGLMIIMLTMQSAMQPSMNSLHRGYELSGIPVNFGLARGIGATAFAVMSFTVGQVLSRVAPRILPVFYLTTVILMLICLIVFRSPSFGAENAREKKASGEGVLKRHPRFAVYLVGLVSLSAAHMFIDNFMLQIMQSVSGDSKTLGVAIAIAAVTELPAMIFYGKASRRVDGIDMLRYAGWVWCFKCILTLLARNPLMIYGAQLLQFFSYAIYVPATVDYIGRTLPREDFLKGQALAGSAFTMGSLLATLLGGRLIDWVGMRPALAYMQIFAVIGAVLFTVALPRMGRATKK